MSNKNGDKKEISIDALGSYLLKLRRMDDAVALKIQGWSYSEIADHLKIDEAAIRKSIFAAMSNYTQDIEENKEIYRNMELTRLDQLQTGIWHMALAGNLDAVDRVLKIMERRTRLLGLDKPVQLDVMDWREEATRVGLNPDNLYEWIVGKFTSALNDQQHIIVSMEDSEQGTELDPYIDGTFYEPSQHGDNHDHSRSNGVDH